MPEKIKTFQNEKKNFWLKSPSDTAALLIKIVFGKIWLGFCIQINVPCVGLTFHKVSLKIPFPCFIRSFSPPLYCLVSFNQNKFVANLLSSTDFKCVEIWHFRWSRLLLIWSQYGHLKVVGELFRGHSYFMCLARLPFALYDL